MTAQPVHVQCHQSIQPSFNFCLVIINSSFLMTFSSQPPAKANRWRTYVILGPYFMIILWDAFILYWVQTSGLDLDWLSSFLGLSPFSLDRALWDALYVMKIIYIEDTKVWWIHHNAVLSGIIIMCAANYSHCDGDTVNVNQSQVKLSAATNKN